MVIIFQNENARRHLLDKGYVFTFRTQLLADGKDWMTNQRGGKKIADVDVHFVHSIQKPDELAFFTEGSGFEQHVEWLDAIVDFHGKLPFGFIYLVILR